MKKKIPIGISDFAELIDPKYNYVFIDKTMFIQQIIDKASKVSLITRPRRWGKTLNMSMLEYFFSPTVLGKPTQGMFDDLAIASVDDGVYLTHQGQYPVIMISLKDIKTDSIDEMMEAIVILFQDLFKKYKDTLINSSLIDEEDKQLFSQYTQGTATKKQLQNGLLFLSKLFYQHYQQKVYILMDEYDSPLNHSFYINEEYFNQVAAFIKALFSITFKDNPYLEKGILTGILRISKESMFSGLNNIEVFSLLRDRVFSPYFGFTENEVKHLFLSCDLVYSEKIQRYYNGYQINELSIYNPWSIINCLKGEGELATYWINTSSNDLMRSSLLKITSTASANIQRLIAEEDYSINVEVLESLCFEALDGNEQALWSLLLSSGYLTPVSQRLVDGEYQCQLKIPNQEVRKLYLSIFKDWLKERLSLDAYEEFLNDLLSGRIDSFTKKLGEYLLLHGSYYDFSKESNYHTFLIGLICGLSENYALTSNQESGHGRPDIILVSRDTKQRIAIIIELKKHGKNAEISEQLAADALQQIDEKHYQAALSNYQPVEKVLKIGLAFSGKSVASCFRWDDLANNAVGEMLCQQVFKEED